MFGDTKVGTVSPSEHPCLRMGCTSLGALISRLVEPVELCLCETGRGEGHLRGNSSLVASELYAGE